MTKVGIIQSAYIPWVGYFDLINSVDYFILFDNTQYTQRNWRNRNYYKSPTGRQWLTVPIKYKEGERIDEVTIDKSTNWVRKHLKTWEQNYSKSPKFPEIWGVINSLYAEMDKFDSLSLMNYEITRAVCSLLGIPTKIISSSELVGPSANRDSVLEICVLLNADRYISGPLAKNYLDVESFNLKGIEVEWFSYAYQLEYKQLYGDFEYGVSIFDLLLNEGQSAKSTFDSLTLSKKSERIEGQ